MSDLPPGMDIQDLVDQAMAEAMQEEESPGGGSEPTSVDVPDVQADAASPPGTGIELLSDVDLHVKIELGRTQMLVEDVLRLGSGAVVELDKLAGDPVDVYVNDRLVARGEVLVLNDNFCIRISEIISKVEKDKEQEKEKKRKTRLSKRRRKPVCEFWQLCGTIPFAGCTR